MKEKILITGATGNVGLPLLTQLYKEHYPVRAAVSSAESAAKLPYDEIEWVRFDFTDPTTFEAAFDGVGKLFLMRPPQIADVAQYIKPVLTYAQKVGVRHITFLSLLGADQNRLIPHHKVERWLLEGDVSYTLLRAGFFMQNLDTTHRRDIADYDELFIPAGHGRTAFIDTRDIAAVAAKTLTEAGHENKAYELTGAEALTYAEVAEVFTAELGRDIRYVNPSLWRFAQRMRQYGHPWNYIVVVATIYLTTKFGLAAKVTPTVEQLLGRPPIQLEDYVQAYAHKWATPSTVHSKQGVLNE